MANLNIYDNTPPGPLLRIDETKHVTLSAGGAGTWPIGTILGRITANGRFTPYNSAAVDGSQVPSAILLAEEVFTGSGTRTADIMLAGHVKVQGTNGVTVYNAGTPLAPTDAELNALRNVAIYGIPVTQLSVFDNS